MTHYTDWTCLPGCLAKVMRINCIGCVVDIKGIQHNSSSTDFLQRVVHATYACGVTCSSRTHRLIVTAVKPAAADRLC